MLTDKNSALDSNFCKSEEVNYQSSEASYHLEKYVDCLAQAAYHQKKAAYHSALLKQEQEKAV